MLFSGLRLIQDNQEKGLWFSQDGLKREEKKGTSVDDVEER